MLCSSKVEAVVGAHRLGGDVDAVLQAALLGELGGAEDAAAPPQVGGQHW
jgi:hypothetical protein